MLILCPTDEFFKLIMHFPRFVEGVCAPHVTISDTNKYSKHSFLSNKPLSVLRDLDQHFE